MAAFQFYFTSGKQKSGVGGDESHVVFGKKFPDETSKSEMVRCYDATASSVAARFRGEFLSRCRNTSQ
jgi:hypothetical protein